MDQIVLKGIGIWLLAIIESIVVFIAFMLGKMTNGLPIEIAIFIGTMLASSQVLLVLIVKHYCKITD